MGVSISEISTRFYLTVSATGDVDISDVKAIIDGEGMPVVVKSSRKENGKTFFLVSTEISRPHIAKVSQSGAAVAIFSGPKEVYSFQIPKSDLDELVDLSSSQTAIKH